MAKKKITMLRTNNDIQELHRKRSSKRSPPKTYLLWKGLHSAGFRVNTALSSLSYEAPYLGPEGGRSGRPTQAVRHTCSGNIAEYLS